MALTPERIKELFNYCQKTGVLSVRKKRPWGGDVGSPVGWKNSWGHLHACIEGERYLIHRVVWAYVHGQWPKGVIDHINGNPDDNRIENLRDVPHWKNLRNAKRRRDNKSGVTGVQWNKENKSWRVRVKEGGKDKEIGSFKDYFEAVCARKSAESRFDYHANHGRR